jgi:hypothetical protein
MNKLPKEKAKELFGYYNKIIQEIGGDLGHEILVSILAKNCALIAVDEILYVLNVSLDFKMNKSIKYWLEVGEEINNL